MAYYRDQGFCDYCGRRVWVGCRSLFFSKWRCETCGTVTQVVGPREVLAREAIRREERAQTAAMHDPSALIAGSSIPPPESGRTYGGLIGHLFGWLVRD